MKMRDRDREVPQIAVPKSIQGKIDEMPQEKALQAAAEQVSQGQVAIKNSMISKANSQAIALATFNAKVALFLVEETKVTLDELELGHATKRMHKDLRRAQQSLNITWEHTQTASLANSHG